MNRKLRIKRATLYFEFHVHGYYLYGFDIDADEAVEIAEFGACTEEELPTSLADESDLAEIFGFELI